jgi:hypothetical protein
LIARAAKRLIIFFVILQAVIFVKGKWHELRYSAGNRDNGSTIGPTRSLINAHCKQNEKKHNCRPGYSGAGMYRSQLRLGWTGDNAGSRGATSLPLAGPTTG